MIRCNPEIKEICTDGTFCEGTYAGEDCYCGRMNRKANAITEFIDDILNAVHNSVLDGEYQTWEDLCVELAVPQEIATGYELAVWGEEDEFEHRYFSASIFWNNLDNSLIVFSSSTSDADLSKAVMEALDRLNYNEKEEFDEQF